MSPFQPGDRVRLTPKGKKAGLQGRAQTPCGTVVSVNLLTGAYVWVARDGIKSEEDGVCYHSDFWELIPGAPAPSAPQTKDGQP